MFGDDFLRTALIGGPTIIFSLTVHEYFHAWTALRFGDTTARDMGRLTLNPLKHLDLMGTLMMVITQFRFGWAKPVPVNPLNLRNRRVAQLWVAAAGPISNIGLAIIVGIVFRLVQATGMELAPMQSQFLRFAVTINLILAVFNLIPLFPLDGSHILKSLLPEELEHKLTQFDRFAPLVLILLLISGVIWIFLWPPIAFMISLILGT